METSAPSENPTADIAGPMSDRELLLANNLLLRSLRTDLDFVVNEVKPLLDGLATSPIAKMMGIK